MGVNNAAPIAGVRPQALSIAAIPSRLSISCKMRTPPSEESCPPSNVAVISLPPMGDSPGRKRVPSVKVSGSFHGNANDTVSTTESYVIPIDYALLIAQKPMAS